MKGRSYGKKTKEERVAERRQKFLEAGIEIFGTIGYRKSKVKDFCIKAKLTERYFYENFKKKEDLLLDCFKLVGIDLFDELSSELSSVNPSNSKLLIEQIINVFVKWCYDNRKKSRILLYEAEGVNKELEKHTLKTNAMFLDLIQSLTELEFSNANLDNEAKKVISYAITSMVTNTTRFWLSQHPNTSPSIVSKNLIFILDSIRINLVPDKS